MKIGLLGAPSTGKTTLAAALSKELGLPVIGDSYDDIYKFCELYTYNVKKRKDETWPEYFDRCWEDGLCNQIYSFESAFHAVSFTKEDEYKNFITETPGPARAVGCLLYCSHLPGYSDDAYRLYKNALSKTYDYLFYLPPILPVVNDGRRPTNELLVRAIDLMLVGMINSMHLKVIDLWSTKLEYRIADALSVIPR